MPTAHQRYQVTETPEVARVLDLAATRWPDEPRSKLLLRLVNVAGALLEHDEQVSVAAHRVAVMNSSGRYAQAFGAGY